MNAKFADAEAGKISASKIASRITGRR